MSGLYLHKESYERIQLQAEYLRLKVSHLLSLRKSHQNNFHLILKILGTLEQKLHSSALRNILLAIEVYNDSESVSFHCFTHD